MQKNKVVLVIDLDGTILSINSFKVWYFTLFFYLFVFFRWWSFAVLVCLSVKRLMKVTDRIEIKSYMLMVSQRGHVLPMLISRTVSFFCSFFIRGDFAKIISDYVTNKASSLSVSGVLIASAAPSLYLEHIITCLPYAVDNVIGSEFIDGEYFECFSGNKFVRVNEKLLEMGCSSYVFFTDHHEDIPTARNALHTFLVSPSAATVKCFNEQKINFRSV